MLKLKYNVDFMYLKLTKLYFITFKFVVKRYFDINY